MDDEGQTARGHSPVFKIAMSLAIVGLVVVLGVLYLVSPASDPSWPDPPRPGNTVLWLEVDGLSSEEINAVQAGLNELVAGAGSTVDSSSASSTHLVVLSSHRSKIEFPTPDGFDAAAFEASVRAMVEKHAPGATFERLETQGSPRTSAAK